MGCKLHFKIVRTQLIPKPVIKSNTAPPIIGVSVYDKILPESIGWSNPNEPMPLIRHLKDGFDRMKPRGWHRNEERCASGLFPVSKAATQLEGWERELVWMEICLLSGNTESSFRALARAWGRDKGFHLVLAQFICERRGNVERRKRVKPQGESTVTKKQRRAPVEMAPSGEEKVLEFDDVDFDVFGVLEGCDLPPPAEVEDPTVNFSAVPQFSTVSAKRGGKRRPPMELAPMHYHPSVPHPQSQHTQQPQRTTNIPRSTHSQSDMLSYHQPHHTMHQPNHHPQALGI